MEVAVNSVVWVPDIVDDHSFTAEEFEVDEMASKSISIWCGMSMAVDSDMRVDSTSLESPFVGVAIVLQ